MLSADQVLSKTHQPSRTAPVLWLLFPASLKQQTTGVGFDSSFTRDLAQSSKVLTASPRKHGYKIPHSTTSWDLSQAPGFEGKQMSPGINSIWPYSSSFASMPVWSWRSQSTVWGFATVRPRMGQVRQTEAFSDDNRSHKGSKITGEEDKSKQWSSWMNSSFSQRKAATGMRLLKGEAAKSCERTAETILHCSQRACAEDYLQI